MVTVAFETEEGGGGEGEGIPRLAQGKKERRSASEETMSFDHNNIVRRIARSLGNGNMGMEESYPGRWPVTALVPFAKGREPGTVGRELQESGSYGQQDVVT